MEEDRLIELKMARAESVERAKAMNTGGTEREGGKGDSYAGRESGEGYIKRWSEIYGEK